ncbi:MAG: tRNA (guanosine(46)-N7)-methyltransferase TrmB, partial [Rhodobacterales bacterium]|nr:tRNA (guanosine(46)-N7)-methyltransferase TrmB [Rhodobacterales bacterium]
MSDTPEPPRRNFYGRIKGKTLRASQKDYLAEDLGPLTLRGVTREDNPSRSVLDLGFVAGPLWLEVGFGGGEHLAAQARMNPDIGYLGVEPFLNGVAKLLAAIEADGLENIRLLRGDGRDVLAALPAGSLARIDLLYPDPWPKRRQRKRR